MYFLNNRVKIFITVLFCASGLLITNCAEKTADPDFHIYLCFGQSNMEGQGVISDQDKQVDDRFLVMQAVDCPELGRKRGVWRTAIPPLSQCNTGLSPTDYFGRTLIENLPKNVKVGVINVAVGGCDIRLFDKNIYQDYDSTYVQDWFLDKVKIYGGNPYKHLVELAKISQKDGLIKGILLHQGETNTGDEDWPFYVAKIYKDLMNDLSLNPSEVPILAGEVVSVQGSCCSSMNPIINSLPEVIKTSHVISSRKCSAMDNAHFDAEGYREMGRRYGAKMLEILPQKDYH